jgi:hypothetical protein
VCVARLGPDSDAKAPASLTVTVARKQGLAPPGSTHGPWYPAVPFNFGRGIELRMNLPAASLSGLPEPRLFKKNLDAPG